MQAVMLSVALLAGAAEVELPPAWVVAGRPAPDWAALTQAGATAAVLGPELLADEVATRGARAAGLRCLALLPLDPAPYGAAGADLLADHPEWRDQDAAGAAAGRCDWAEPKLRAAVVAWATRAAGQVDGLLLSALPPDQFAGRPAWSGGHGPAMAALSRARYGREPKGLAEGSLGHLLHVKATGEPLTLLVRELRAAVKVPLYLALAAEDALPETARWRYVDLRGLLADGLLAGVFLCSPAGLDLRRPRLETDRAIVAGLACAADPVAGLSALLRTRDADALLVTPATPLADWLQALRKAAEGSRRAERERATLAEELARGDLLPVAGAEAKGKLDLATIHGVAQSFRLAKPCRVAAVGLCCTLRGTGAIGLPDLALTIRPDDGGRPDLKQVLAEARIPPAAFAGGGFQWGYARFAPPLALEAGRTYWLHAADTTSGGNSLVWQLSRDGYADGRAWSSKYDYGQYDWLFRVLVAKEQAR